MREIKFRAWDPNPSFGFQKRMYYDIIVGRGVVLAEIDEDEFAEENLEPTYSTLDNSKAGFIVMQYTGLKDKNGKEIYEGDIIKGELQYPQGSTGSLPTTGVVEYSDGFGAFGLKNDAGTTLFEHHLIHTFEVIGNIYESELTTNS